MDEQLYHYQVQVVGIKVVKSWIAVSIEEENPDAAIDMALWIVGEYPDEICWRDDSEVMNITSTLAVVDEDGENN